MKKKVRMPAFLLDYTAVWNPLIGTFLHNIISKDDISHVLRKQETLGLNDQI